MIADDPYVYPGTTVLRNKLSIRDSVQLERVERRLVVQRVTEGVPEGAFDLRHLRAIHRHLFQDVFEWAGELRKVEISKAGFQFQFRQFIETGMADIHRRLVRMNFLRDLGPRKFAAEAGVIMGDVNYVHPFRDGNGRTQLQYLDRLAARAGHPLEIARIDPARWLAASKSSHEGDYDLIADEIGRIMRAA